ncbi:peptidase domain-containing ABC transporter [Geothrix alkalitolerans]|uniref:peptidase domain-containing ABC transporter n=1 Tax=Geothrix alkalitolerans TaxID=2922724 RepID=UPI001FAEB563|nr:peptidase domain-containing ABC transporter [Geothrix alkalitolerans]
MARRVPYIPQMGTVECGAAALAMVLAYWRHHAPPSEVRERCKVSRDGSTATNILRAAREYGLEAEAASVEVEDLHRLPMPAILHWDFNHFVVLERVSRKGFHIVDPRSGRCFVSMCEFRLSFTGVALMFQPGDGFARRRHRFPSLSRYLALIREARSDLALVLATSLLLLLLSFAFPAANRLLVDGILVPHDRSLLLVLVLTLVFSLVGRLALGLARSYVVQNLQNQMGRRLIEGFVTHLVSLPIGFFLQRQPGDLMQRVDSNSHIRDFFSSRSLATLVDSVMLIGIAATMVVLHRGMALLVLAASALRTALLLALRQRNQQLMSTELALAGQETGLLLDVLVNIETVKAASSERKVALHWLSRAIRRANALVERSRLATASTHAMNALQGVTLAGLFWVGGAQVAKGAMTLGAFFGFLSLYSLFVGPLESTFNAMTDLQYLLSHMARLDDIMECPGERSGTVDPGRLQGGIVLEGVSFRYAASSPWVVRDVSLTIRPGEKIALVGPSGAGKSTLARMLLGMHLPTEGRIRFDDVDLAKINLSKMRSQVGVVLQDSFLLNDSISANIAWQEENLPEGVVQWASGIAHLHEVVRRLPLGYRTPLGENANILSGGERQRVCLARAIARRPPILLMDEATSALDLETEAIVHANLAELGCTRIVIAHRLETIKDAHRVVVMEEGAIVQVGSFGDLSREEGPLRRIIAAMEGGHG